MKPLSEFCCINPNCSEYGTEGALKTALESSPVSDTVNTSFVERQKRFLMGQTGISMHGP